MADRAIANEVSASIQFSGVVYPNCSVETQPILDETQASNCHVQYAPKSFQETAPPWNDRVSNYQTVVLEKAKGIRQDYIQMTIVPN